MQQDCMAGRFDFVQGFSVGFAEKAVIELRCAS